MHFFISTAAFPDFYFHNYEHKNCNFIRFLFLSQGIYMWFSNFFSVVLKYLKLHIFICLGQIGDTRVVLIVILPFNIVFYAYSKLCKFCHLVMYEI